MLEDLDYYCVDNLPPLLLDTFYDLCENSTDNRMKRVAVVADARSGEMFAEIADVLQKAKLDGRRFKILFLDAKLDTLVIRYKETRRKHPLLGEMVSGSTEEAVELEDELMKAVREMADYVIDTTIPMEADLIFDVRCLPNPFYVPELKLLTGLDEAVVDYVMSFEVSRQFMKKLIDFIDFSIPLYKQEGKSEVVIGIGCTGGKHRSVTVARLLNTHLIERSQKSSTHHRDIWKA